MAEYINASFAERARRSVYQLGYASSIAWGTGIVYSLAHGNIRDLGSFTIITAANFLVAKTFHEVQREEDRKSATSLDSEPQFEPMTELRASQTFFLEEQEEHPSQ